MSLKWKYIVVAEAAVVVTAALFVILHKLTIQLEHDVLLQALVGIVALALSLVLISAYRSFVAKPLARVRSGAERLTAGDRTARVELTGGDEMAQIGRCVNRMAESLIAVQEDLERQVAERTRDLQQLLAEVQERSRELERANHELAEQDQRKTQFLTNVSHELRTPLNSIVGFLNLLKDGLYSDERERAEFLSNAELCAGHLILAVTDVLSAARIEAGYLEANVAEVDSGAMIVEVANMLEVQRRGRSIVLRIENEGDTRVVADELKLRQILMNLVANALKFTEVGDVTVRAERDGEVVRFEVSDNGDGIEAEELERIFEKFHQAENTRAHHQGGTGLGLSITRELVELMGGEIHAESDGAGKGSRFLFTLPAARAVAPVESTA